MTKITQIEKGDHLCIDRKTYYHHFIITANSVNGDKFCNEFCTEEQRKKELEIVEFDSPEEVLVPVKGKIKYSYKDLSELGDVYKIHQADARDPSELQFNLNLMGFIHHSKKKQPTSSQHVSREKMNSVLNNVIIMLDLCTFKHKFPSVFACDD